MNENIKMNIESKDDVISAIKALMVAFKEADEEIQKENLKLMYSKDIREFARELKERYYKEHGEADKFNKKLIEKQKTTDIKLGNKELGYLTEDSYVYANGFNYGCIYAFGVVFGIAENLANLFGIDLEND